MAPGRTSSRVASPAAAPLPQVSFRKVEDEDVNEPAGVSDPSSRPYGYNDFSFFTRPDHYIRYIEPIESELTNQVEYDMDEQDQEWLDLVNEDRRKAQVGPVSPEVFEIMMDRLEKEWFELMKRVPKPDIGLPSEDSTCAICDDGEGENSNAIVFCDGCNLAVHQDCYGVPYIPEGQWLCRKCTVSPEIPVPCVFCPNEGGAFKQTSTGQWAHLLCAMFVPEVTVGNTMFMEPIDNIEKVPKSRWKLTCSLCKIKHGACIQCDKTTCFAAFHVTCARRAKLLMGMKGLSGEEASFKGYCEKHLPDDVKKSRGEIGDLFEGPITITARTPKSSKSARAYAKKYSLGPPLVPQLIADKLQTYYKKHFRQKSQFIQLVCKYWSLKREARRGAPLLKRLHLEPWSVSTVSKQQTDQEKVLKLQYLTSLRKDLEKVRTLTELTRKREQQKLSQAQLLHDAISKVLFPHEPAIKLAFEQIHLLDKNGLFHRPVTRAEAPDYFDIIKNPMSFTGIEANLEKGEYLDLQSFKSDINLVFDNAMLYNKRDTVFHKTAARLKASAAQVLASLDTLTAPRPESLIGPEISSEAGHVGDLEADLEILKMLLSEEAIKDDMNLVIGTEPITSLFRFECAVLKPPPPPPPLKPKKERPKRDYKVERERRKQAQAALAAHNTLLLDTSPGFRAPRATRSTKAALAALEAQLTAGSLESPDTNLTGGNTKPGSSPSSSQEPRAGQVDATVAQPIPDSQRPRTIKRRRSWKREHVMLPGQGGPNIVESMDNQGSFKNFDRGWILPSGSRRHGRAVPSPPPARDPPPPKKGSHTDRERSRLSVVSTEPADNMTLQPELQPCPGGSEKSSEAPAPAESAGPMDVDQPVARHHRPDLKEQNAPPIPSEYFSPVRITRSSGIIGGSVGSSTVPPESVSSTHGVKRKRSGTNPSVSSQPDVDADEDWAQARESLRAVPPKKSRQKGGKQPVSFPVSKPKGLGPKQGVITLQEGEMLMGGTLVWAKMDSYPWWAAVVWEEDTKGVPMNVLRSKASMARNEPGPLTLVQFYDKARSWQWLALSNLRLLGEDKELDLLLLSGRAKIQSFRTSKLKQGCRQAYRQAVAEMEDPERETNEGTTNPSMELSASAEPILRVSGGIHQELPRPLQPSSPQYFPPPQQSPPPQLSPVSQLLVHEPQQTPSEDVHMKNEPLADPALGVTDAISGPEDLTPPPEVDDLPSQTALSSDLSDLESNIDLNV